MINKIIFSLGLCAGSFLSAMESLPKKKLPKEQASSSDFSEVKDFKQNKIWISEKNLPQSVLDLIKTGKVYCKDLQEIRKNLSFRFVQATDTYVQDIIFVKPD